MPKWHITIMFQAPRGADIKVETLDELVNALLEVSAVTHTPANELEFMLTVETSDSVEAYTAAYQRVAEVCTDVLGLPVEFLRGEVVDYDHFVQKLNIAHP